MNAALVFLSGLLAAVLVTAVVLAVSYGVYEPIIGGGIALVVVPVMFGVIGRIIDG